MEDMYGDKKTAPTPEGLHTHTLSILGLSYIVKAYEGSWWTGCCCRQRYQKAVLRNISLHLESAELTAILGNSGIVWCGVVCGVVGCDVVWCGVVWCGVVWCGVVCWFGLDWVGLGWVGLGWVCTAVWYVVVWCVLLHCIVLC